MTDTWEGGETYSIPYKYMTKPTQAAVNGSYGQASAVTSIIRRVPSLRFVNPPLDDFEAKAKITDLLTRNKSVLLDIDSAGAAIILENYEDYNFDKLREGHKDAGSDWLDLSSASLLAFRVENETMEKTTAGSEDQSGLGSV